MSVEHPEDPGPVRGTSLFEFSKRFAQRDLSLRDLTGMDGAAGDGFRLLHYALEAVGAKLRHRYVPRPENREWGVSCSVASGGHWSKCLLHVPTRVFERPSRDEFEQFEICIRHIWRCLRSGKTDDIDQILVFAYKSREVSAELTLFSQQLSREHIEVVLRTWGHVSWLVRQIKQSGRQIVADDVKDLVANPETGVRGVFTVFFCLPERL